MNTPLGRAAGNWLEVKESAACLEPNVLPASRRQNQFNFWQDASNTLDDLRSLVVGPTPAFPQWPIRGIVLYLGLMSSKPSCTAL